MIIHLAHRYQCWKHLPIVLNRYNIVFLENNNYYLLRLNKYSIPFQWQKSVPVIMLLSDNCHMMLVWIHSLMMADTWPWSVLRASVAAPALRTCCSHRTTRVKSTSITFPLVSTPRRPRWLYSRAAEACSMAPASCKFDSMFGCVHSY